MMQEWDKIARKLECGRTVRTECCAKDLSRIISHSEKGYSAYCFRCGSDSRRFKPHGERSLAELIQHRKELNTYVHQTKDEICVPADTADFFCNGVAGITWLLQAGVSQALAEYYDIGWSEKLGRVILPVYSEGKLIAVQARAVFPNQKPKYLNRSGAKTPLFYSKEETMLDNVLPDTLIVCEDILSTIRVGRLCASVGTLGTHLSNSAASELVRGRKRVVIWYDNDDAGKRGATRARKTLELQGAEVSVIKSEYDPKAYNNDEIRSILLNVEL